MIELMGSVIGFLFLGLIIFLIVKSIGTHPELFELEEDEEIKDIVKGDYWVKKFLWQETQYPGEFAFTNKRILFKATFLSPTDKNISIPYSEIATIKKSFVGLFFPVAFTVITKDDKSYKIAVLKRDKYIDLIQTLAQNK